MTLEIPKTVEGHVVAICVPIYDDPTVNFWRSMQTLWKPSRGSAQFGHKGATHTFDTRGITIPEARMIMTGNALDADPKVTHLLWVDDDMEFPPHALKRLLDHDVPIVGGLCHNRRSPYQPILGKKHQDGRNYGFCYHYPPDSLFEVDVTGGAFLLVKREVFEKVSEQFGHGQWWEKYKGLSEDFSFCERARECGYKILVDTGLEIGHVGEIVIRSHEARLLRPYQWEAWNPDPGLKEGEPCASIIIPVYNQKPRFLKAAVLSASHQNVPVEVIIVDDGSDTPVPDEGWPENVSVVHHTDYDARHEDSTLRPQNRGISAALNTGIDNMKTDWFCWLSSDDIMDPRKVQMQLAQLQQSGGKCGFHRWQAIKPDGGFASIAPLIAWKNLAEQQEVLAQVCAVNGSTVMIHKSVFDAVGKFDEGYKYGQDWEMWCRIAERFFWFPLDEILGTRREHGNLTAAIAQSASDDERRLRRDAEDASIKARYRWPR